MCPEDETRPGAQVLEALNDNPVQVDDAAEDADSTFGGSQGAASDYTSLASSIYNYKYENGRRYHAFHEGAYILPNDEEEQDRMDMVHHLYSLGAGGALFNAPIKEDPGRVLDLGTGTGIWAMEFADQYPSAEVIGTDLSPIQPKWIPPNCTFEVDDYEAEWVYKTPFDYIHARELEGCIVNDVQLIENAFKHLNPGGWFEMQATNIGFMSDDGTHKKAENCQVWAKHLLESAAKFGKPMDLVVTWKEKMEEAGFVDIQQEVWKVPLGPWAKDPRLKEMGKFQKVHQLQAVEAYSPALFSRVLGWKPEAIDVFLALVKKELLDPAMHLYIPVFSFWGRKPGDAETHDEE